MKGIGGEEAMGNIAPSSVSAGFPELWTTDIGGGALAACVCVCAAQCLCM